ncbi:2Fe-2S iron-sulfur cluster-binding protein [Bradyrhizobium genosp. L]|uniref:2Fe-2S iron-sulfur cluster-binding protein n=1 Tax=Bradyrhizobium genosp. L TaxID=83637 RepID=UPI001FED387C|nr:2Fe-2S iron-sulfur cluster-binding protein [Bradyrhizobium genosp. L]
MAFTASALRHGKLVAAAAIAFGLMTSASHAYTDEQQQMCTGDAMRLCSSEIPDVDRVTACMVRQRALLSDGCKAVFHYVPPATTAQPASYAPATKPGKPLSITPHKRG